MTKLTESGIELLCNMIINKIESKYDSSEFDIIYSLLNCSNDVFHEKLKEIVLARNTKFISVSDICNYDKQSMLTEILACEDISFYFNGVRKGTSYFVGDEEISRPVIPTLKRLNIEMEEREIERNEQNWYCSPFNSV